MTLYFRETLPSGYNYFSFYGVSQDEAESLLHDLTYNDVSAITEAEYISGMAELSSARQ